MTCQIDAVWHCLAYECFNLTTFSLQKHDGSSMGNSYPTGRGIKK